MSDVLKCWEEGARREGMAEDTSEGGGPQTPRV